MPHGTNAALHVGFVVGNCEIRIVQNGWSTRVAACGWRGAANGWHVGNQHLSTRATATAFGGKLGRKSQRRKHTHTHTLLALRPPLSTTRMIMMMMLASGVLFLCFPKREKPQGRGPGRKTAPGRRTRTGTGAHAAGGVPRGSPCFPVGPPHPAGKSSVLRGSGLEMDE